jgi:hypothetical protein
MQNEPDKAVWATWYDVAPDRREAYLAWLHREYLPFIAARPGYLWVAHYADQGGGAQLDASGKSILHTVRDGVGHGTQYVLAVGAASSHAFFEPSPDTVEAEADRLWPGMLGQRQGVRPNIFIEESRVYGPAHPPNGYGLMPGPVVMFGTFRMPSVAQEFDLGRWYILDRLAMMTRTPGCIRVRKMVSTAGWAKFAAFYEFETMEDRLRWKDANARLVLDPDHWSRRVVGSTQHVPGSPTIGLRTWPIC